MEKVIVIGAGGHSAEIDEYIRHSAKCDRGRKLAIVGFLDDNKASFDKYSFSAPFLGGIVDHTVDNSVKYIIGIANLNYRRPIIERFVSLGAEFITIIHPDSYISVSSKIGNGVIIAPNVNVGPNVEIGDFNLVNSRSSLGHDTKIGRYNFISPNVCFSGFTTVGEENLFGINAATIPNITVGNRNRIAAGMVLDQNVGDDQVVFFRYKEKVIAVPRR